MIKRELSAGVIEYVFEPRQQHHHYANKIIALVNEGEVMLIDTGYEDEAQQVLNDLAANRLVLHSVIISHFHDDHMEGLKALPRVPVYGSKHYQQTLDKWTPKEEHKLFTPTVVIEDITNIQFGPHAIEIIVFPGHSVCTVLVKIDDTFIHVADEVMFSNQGEPLLPCVRKDAAITQYHSLGKLKSYTSYRFIPAHGDNIKSKDDIVSAIENSMLYLKQVYGNDKRISYEEATKDCTRSFLHKEWHENTYK